MKTINGLTYNICQANRTPGGSSLCMAKLAVDKRGSTKSMSNHLRRHGIYQKQSNTGAIAKFLEKGKLEKKLDCDSLTSAVACFFIRCNIPFHIIERQDFKDLLRLCNPSTMSLLCARDTLASFISTAFLQGQSVLQSQFSRIQSKINLPCDTWTSPSNLSILGVTAHWITDDFSLKSIILAAELVEGNHSGVSLATHLLQVLKRYNLCNKIFCITADNASNNGTMANHLANLIPFNPKTCMLGCMAHVINLAAQAGIKAFLKQTSLPLLPSGLSNILDDQPDQVEINSLISPISGFTTFLKRSPQKAASFLEITNGMTGKKLAMVQDVSTRWNSTFQMLQRALKLRACIAVFCQTNNLEEKYGLTADEWKKVKQLCDFLEPLNEATDTISPEKTTSLVFGAPVYICLIERLNDVGFSSDYTSQSYSFPLISCS